MFSSSVKMVILRHLSHRFMVMSRMSPLLPCATTGNTCRKSPPNTTVLPPKIGASGVFGVFITSCPAHKVNVWETHPEETVNACELQLVAHRSLVPYDEAAVSE